MNHFEAIHTLRILVSETGNLGHTDSLNFILDELREAHHANARLIVEREEARHKVAELVQNLELHVPDLRREQTKRKRQQALDRIHSVRGVIPWKEGDELPEATIRRLRDAEPDEDPVEAVKRLAAEQTRKLGG